MRRKPLNPQTAQAEGVDYLLREFKALRTARPSTGGSSGDASSDGPIEVSYLVAADDARDDVKAVADYVCDGTADDVEINAALAACGANPGGGRVVLTEGTFYIAESITGSAVFTSRLEGAGQHLTILRTSGAGSGNIIGGAQGLTEVSDMSLIVTHSGWGGCLNTEAATAESRNFYRNIFVEATTGTAWGIYLRNYGVIENCAVGVSHASEAIHVAGYNAVIVDSFIHGGTYGIRGNSSVSPSMTIIGNQISGCSTYDLYVNDSDAIVVGNRIVSGLFDTGATNVRYGGNVGTITDNAASSVPMDNDSIAAADVSPLTTKGDLWGFDTVDDRIPVGTDDHVLTADSSEGLGVKWAAKSPLTTKGDLHVYTTVDARLAVGTDDHVLTADASEASGVKWAAAGSGTDGAAIHDDTAAEISAITAKATPTTSDYLLIEDAAASDAKKSITIGDLPGIGQAVPLWVEHLADRTAGGESVHGDDDEFTGTIAGTAVTPTGTATWTQSHGVLSGVFSGNSASDACARLYSLTPTSSPVTIETAIRIVGSDSNYPFSGVIFTDGTTATDDAIAANYYLNSADYGSISNYHGTIGNLSTSLGSGQAAGAGSRMGLIYLRLIWSAVNTFKSQWSPDGVSWIDMLTGTSKTMTPTYFGVFGSAWGATNNTIVTFEYLRVTESDLSA